jgi:hypothetical protein
MSGRRGDGAGVEAVEKVMSLNGVRGIPVLDLFGVEIGLEVSLAVSVSTKMLKSGLRFLLGSLTTGDGRTVGRIIKDRGTAES